jgi:hypothetical protein
VRGLALVLTAMNLARHSKESKHKRLQKSSSLDVKTSYSSAAWHQHCDSFFSQEVLLFEVVFSESV